MNTYRGFRDALRSFIPVWLQDRPSFRNGYKILYVCALLCDIALSWIVQAVYSWFPGYSLGISATGGVDAASALPLIAQSRGILRGEADTDASFAAWCLGWLSYWEAAASAEILVAMIQHYLGNHPMVRMVDRNGNWVTIDTSGHITKATAVWNWDGVSNPERAGWWSDLWIIVYPTEWPITGTSLASLVPLWGVSQLGTGHAVGRIPVYAILEQLEQWKGAHTWCEAIIWSYDSTLFVPGAPVSGDPDGTWGSWSKYTASLELVVARTGASDGRVRYWVPAGG